MRIRTIKPEFWTDKRVASWDPFTRLFFIGLWSAADDHGRGSAEPQRLAAELFPYDLSRDSRETLANVSRALASLSECSRIALYEVSGEAFYQVVHWTRHQRVDKPGKSRIPLPTEGVALTQSSELATPSRDSRDTIATGTGNREQVAMDQGNKGTDRAQAPRVRFQPPTREELNAEAEKLGLPSTEVDRFVDYYSSNGWKVGKNPMKSWPHALSGWASRWREKASTLSLGSNRYATATPDDAPF